jgi:3-hydroxy-9,10-secoandrosta-1,3,5(10)-triene-9,17-dione monooxygenase reductase component
MRVERASKKRALAGSGRREGDDMQAPTGFDTRTLRDALGAFATGVTIVTTRNPDGDDVGLTANSFSSVSLNPPMVLWSLARTSSSIEAFRNATHFAVHILAAGQEPLSTRFATKGIDKFAGVEVERGPNDVPMMRDCTARFACRTAFQHEGGDHVIFVGEILDFMHSDRAPLVFHGGRYGMLSRTEAARQQPAPAPAAEDVGTSPSPDDLIYHLSRAYFRIRRDAIQERQRRGWTDLEYAALSALGWEDGRRVAEIDALRQARGQSVTPEMVAALAARGLVEVAEPIGMDSQVRLTPAGRQALIEIMAMLKAGEAEALEGFDPSEVQLLKQLLRRIGDA